MLARLLGSGFGPVFALGVGVVSPFVMRIFTDDTGFALYALLATIAFVSLNLDFGAASLLTTDFRGSRRRKALVLKCAVLTSVAALGVTAMATVAYGGLRSGFDVSLEYALSAILLTGVGAVGRSLVNLMSVVGLAVFDNRLRNETLVIQSIGQISTMVVALILGYEALAFPIGMVGGVLFASAFSWRRFARLVAQQPVGASTSSAGNRSFLAGRTMIGLLQFMLTQADRWLVGYLAGSEALATYELIVRIAVLPRYLVGALGPGMVAAYSAELGRGEGTGGGVSETYSKMLRLSTSILVLGLSATGVLVYGIGRVGVGLGPIQLVALVLLLNVVHGIATPGSAMLTALHKPLREVPSLGVGIATAGLLYALGSVFGDSRLVFVAAPAGLAIASLVLMSTRPWKVAI